MASATPHEDDDGTEHAPGEAAERTGAAGTRARDRAADRLLLAAGRHSTLRTTVLCLTSAAAAGANLALPAALGRALDLLLATGRADGGAAPWIALCAALTCALVALDALDTVLTGTLNSRTTAWLRTRLLDHVLAIGPGPAARFGPGDLVTRSTGNAAHAGTAPSAAASTLAALATPLGGLVALALLDPRLVAVFLAGTPVLFFLLRAFSRTSSDSVARYQEAQGRIAARLVEALGGARTIAAAGTWRRERDRVLEPLAELSGEGHRMWRVQGRATAQAAVLVPLLQIAVVAVGGVLLAAGELSVGGLLAAARYAVLAAGVGVLVGQLNGLVRARAAARRLAEVHEVPALAQGHRALPAEGPGALELRGVRATRGTRTVLDGVDLVVPGGRTVALVGRSGSGKSLLAALAGRLAEPEAGRVLLDGVDLAELDRAELRRAVGYAFERPALLGGTIAGTIAFGPEGVGGDDGRDDARHAAVPERVAAAARAACADDFIRTLPDGYGTPCAEAPLSGGEVQRLGLARAFAHDGRLLILDDATSSLDTVTELRVSEALLNPPGDADCRARTRLIVAHRASTAARADVTAWLDGGRVRALGPHERLWRLPEYRAVFGEGGQDGDGAGPEVDGA
ncbi:ABC transporter transmembrane domain-containing protein [Streptomyces sp. NPDC054796]